jgi:putative acetyltransferase
MIQKATPEDFEFFYNLYMHPLVNPYLLYEPMNRESFQPIYDDLLSKEALFMFLVNDIKTGMFKLVPFTYRSSHIVYLGGLAIHPDYGGLGYGKLMMQEIIKYTSAIGFKRIELSTATSNDKAIRLYEQAGFVKEGILRKYTYLKSQDIFLDEVLMSYVTE